MGASSIPRLNSGDLATSPAGRPSPLVLRHARMSRGPDHHPRVQGGENEARCTTKVGEIVRCIEHTSTAPHTHHTRGTLAPYHQLPVTATATATAVTIADRQAKAGIDRPRKVKNKNEIKVVEGEEPRTITRDENRPSPGHAHFRIGFLGSSSFSRYE